MSSFAKKLIFHLGIVITVVGALMTAIVFLGGDIKNKVELINQSRQELAKKSTSIGYFTKLKSQYETKGKKYLEILDNFIPNKDKLINLNQELQFLAAQNKLGYNFSFIEEEQPKEGRFGYIKFRLILNGDLKNIFKFVRDLENFRYLTKLEDFNISPVSNQSQMFIKGQTFFK